MSLGIGIGTALGVSFGLLTDNLALGIGIAIEVSKINKKIAICNKAWK